MPFLITNVYHQWNTCNSYSWVKKSYGHQTTLFVGISGGTNISTVEHDELNIFLLHSVQSRIDKEGVIFDPLFTDLGVIW